MSYDAVVQAGRRGACGGCVDPAPEKGPARVRVPRLGLHRPRGLLAIVVRQVQPLLDWLRTLDGYFQGQSPAVLLQVLGIALVAQLARRYRKEAGFPRRLPPSSSAAGCLALLQALPLLQSLLGSFAAYLQ